MSMTWWEWKHPKIFPKEHFELGKILSDMTNFNSCTIVMIFEILPVIGLCRFKSTMNILKTNSTKWEDSAFYANWPYYPGQQTIAQVCVKLSRAG